jgi:hypothetical protein
MHGGRFAEKTSRAEIVQVYGVFVILLRQGCPRRSSAKSSPGIGAHERA